MVSRPEPSLCTGDDDDDDGGGDDVGGDGD